MMTFAIATFKLDPKMPKPSKTKVPFPPKTGRVLPLPPKLN